MVDYNANVTYKNSNGDVHTLNSTFVKCNVREIRPYTYSRDEGAFSYGDKEFEMTIIVSRWADAADALIDIMMHDAANDTYGHLSVNNWEIRCKCLGVTLIDTQFEGIPLHHSVYKYVARFYAPKGYWIKRYYWRYHGPSNTWSQRRITSGITSWIDAGTWAYATERGQYALEFSPNYNGGTSGTMNGSIVFEAYPSEVDNEKNYYKINLSSAAKVKSNFEEKIAFDADTLDQLLSDIPDDSDWFKILNSDSTWRVKFVSGTISGYIYLTMLEIRGMPRWNKE